MRIGTEIAFGRNARRKPTIARITRATVLWQSPTRKKMKNSEAANPSQQGEQELYEACLRHLAAKGYWSTYHAISDDGFDPKVNYRKLMEE
jgi:hypothetical protein